MTVPKSKEAFLRSTENVQKIEIIKQPKQSNTASWVALFVSLGVLLWSMYWSIYTYKQFLPLQKSNVIFSEADIEITQSMNDMTVDEETGKTERMPVDNIVATIKNVGKAEARNIKFRIYTFGFSEESTLGEPRRFNDKLVHSLQSGESARFGTVIIGHLGKKGGKNYDMVVNKERSAMLYHLEYTDSISNEPQNRVFFFIYTVGSNYVGSLICKDYEKVQDRLENYFNEEDNDYVLNYIKNSPCS